MWEDRFRYSRAVVVGRQVYVGGTAPQMPHGGDPPRGAYAQARRCLEIVVAALAEAGAGPGDVVRTRIYVTRADIIEDVMRAHGEVFGAARPAVTGVVVELLDRRWLVEIEVDAVLPS
ncbi:MAG: Rid family hydrolase [Actinomycetota bacterium]|nr:Rid family hydrolase [Actinomycetota bacterium]